MAKHHNWSKSLDTGNFAASSMRRAFEKALTEKGIVMPKSSAGIAYAINSKED